MIKNRKLIFAACAVFSAVEIYLSYLIQTTSARVNPIQYSAVLLACIFCFLSVEKSKSYIFTQAGLIATVCADYFLVHILEMDQLSGMIRFAFAQIFYFLRLYFEETDIKRKERVPKARSFFYKAISCPIEMTL